MFPNFTSLSQREQKRQSLIRQAEQDLQIDDAKRQAYSQAIWADDVAKNQLTLNRSKASIETQTNTMDSSNTSSGSNSSSTGPSDSSAGPSNQPMNSIQDALPTQPAPTSQVPDEEITSGRSQGNSTDGMEPLSSRPNASLSLEAIKERIKQAYTNMPSLATLRINPMPVKAGDKDIDDKVYFGPSGDLYSESTRKPVIRKDRLERLDDKIDWFASLHYIETKGLRFGAVRNKFDELENKNMKDAAMGALYKNYVTNVDERYNYVNPRDLEEFEEETKSEAFNNAASSEANELLAEMLAAKPRYSMNTSVPAGSDEDIKAAIDTLVTNNRELVEKYEIVAIKKDGTAVGRGYKLSPYLLEIVTNTGNSTDTAKKLTKEISWKDTYDAWIQKLLKNKKTQNLNTYGTNIKATSNKRGLADSTSSLRPDQARARLNPTSTGYRARIKFLFTRYPALTGERIPITVFNPITGRHEFDQMYEWNSDGEIIERVSRRRPRNMDEVLARVAWGRSYMVIRQFIANMLKAMMQRNDTSEYEGLKRVVDAADSMPLSGSADEDIPEDFATRRGKKIVIVGRGLMGAGHVGGEVSHSTPSSAGVKRSTYTCKNLRVIEGSGTASDLKYKRLGSKFIRVADLKANKLKLVYPNRTSVGKLRDIHPTLAQLINKLLFEHDIDQQLYGELSIEDRKLFCEVLRATHLQHQFSNAPEDPLESLKGEFDKLRAQVLMGNNNKDLVRELKALSVDLYSQKLISEDDFREIVLI